MLFAIPSASFECINAMLHQTFLFLGQLWQLFEVSQILKFLQYMFSQCIFDFETRKKQMFTEAHAFSRVTYFFIFWRASWIFS